MYISRHVVFLEHILFYSLSSDLHTHTRSKLIHIDHFSFDDDISSYCNVENCRVYTISTPNLDVSLVPTAFQQPHAIVDPTPHITTTLSPLPPLHPRRYPSCHCKYTNFSDYIYSIYSTSFVYLLTYIHSFPELSSYKKVILDPLW